MVAKKYIPKKFYKNRVLKLYRNRYVSPCGTKNCIAGVMLKSDPELLDAIARSGNMTYLSVHGKVTEVFEQLKNEIEDIVISEYGLTLDEFRKVQESNDTAHDVDMTSLLRGLHLIPKNVRVGFLN